ncbi:uncharacterized protein LOC133227011 isoform X3 [Bos javanicus]|uniref:uncharacterized protein LOC133227011 isoform X3 n=1 Tax=Bos javanicus TaxID=9906 RepID=UPI002AA6BA0C|nr:uncharacterized protein LOC133227011 isoform X3 [Bos javanicus]XP_061237224.1 uncharacterized protein LOC133227011 isoform X3 [Bos javanicus]
MSVKSEELGCMPSSSLTSCVNSGHLDSEHSLPQGTDDPPEVRSWFLSSECQTLMPVILVTEALWAWLLLLLGPTLCDPMDCSLPGSSIHGIFQCPSKLPIPFELEEPSGLKTSSQRPREGRESRDKYLDPANWPAVADQRHLDKVCPTGFKLAGWRSFTERSLGINMFLWPGNSACN